MCSINCSSLFPPMKRLCCRCYMSLLDCFRYFHTADICQSNILHASEFCHKLCSENKVKYLCLKCSAIEVHSCIT